MHKNLVGGTATTGTGRKQTLRLGECCVVKPLTVVGTFSAFNNTEKVMEKWLQISPIFRLVKIVSLVAVLSTGFVSESRAACSVGMYEKNGKCEYCYSSIPSCASCSYDDNKNRVVCESCSSAVLSEDGSKCLSGYLANNSCPPRTAKVNGKCEIMVECKSNDSNGLCAQCYTGYHLDENKVCIADENQIILDESLTDTVGCTDTGQWGCNACAEGYFFLQQHCYLISDLPNCSDISEDSTYGSPCLRNGIPGCDDGYQHNRSECRKCYGVPTCHYDPQINMEVPDSCVNGYYVTESTNDCRSYSYCMDSPNMYFNTTENKCKYKPDGCKNVNPDGSCVADEPCWEGYVKNASGKCYKPVESCEDGKFAKEDQCVSDCGSGYLVKSGTTCVEPESCTGEYIVDSANNACIKMPGCLNYADGACGGCEKNFYKKGNGCVSAQEGCGSGYLEKDSVCISSANGCGDGYKDMGGYCNRVRYTPAEAAAIANDDNTNVVTLTFKK